MRLPLASMSPVFKFNKYIQKLVYDILFTYDIKVGSIITNFEMDDINLNMDTAIPLGLLTNELITNIVKHAFPESKWTITIKLKYVADKIEFTIADDGIGIPTDIDFENSDTLGLEIVKNLVNQLEGDFNIENINGTEFKMIFKELKYKVRR
jgi:two-component sensor histidine kinase